LQTSLRCLVLALAFALATGITRADDYPSRPIRLIVPYAAGGGADSVARIIAKRVSETIGQIMVAPDVPTVSESGYPGFDAIAWHGFLAPANTPPAIVNKLNAEIVAALKDLETSALLEQQAMQIIGSSPAAFTGFIKQDIAIWKQVADQARVEVR
jgi:tripartite-type tricarboxylate transporter receptor subunit TctC